MILGEDLLFFTFILDSFLPNLSNCRDLNHHVKNKAMGFLGYFRTNVYVFLLLPEYRQISKGFR